MKKFVMTAVILTASTCLAFAQAPKSEDNSVSGKEMKDSPTTKGGTTATPNAKPTDGSVSDKTMKDNPGVTGAGKTDMPNAKPMDGSISDKEMKDNPGVSK
jgi:hypothetical protein